MNRVRANRGGRLLAASFCLIVAAAPATAGTPLATPSLGGMTGLFNTPTAEVSADGDFHLGYNLVDRKWSFEGRGRLDNRIYFLTVGFFPNFEASVRATIWPRDTNVEGVESDAVDRLASARYRLWKDGSWPALAVGIDDAKGTRRYHSLYLVTTKHLTTENHLFSLGLSLGHGFKTLDAARYLLDGTFGGADIILGKKAIFVVEYDSEKWNGGLKLLPFPQLTAQLAFLNFETPSGGISLSHHF